MAGRQHLVPRRASQGRRPLHILGLLRKDAVPYTISFASQDRRPRRNISLARWERVG